MATPQAAHPLRRNGKRACGLLAPVGSYTTPRDVTPGGSDCIVLAQASMRVAASKLEDVGIPVLTSPLMAAKRSIHIATYSL
jgi:hypothetical protein